MGRQSDFSPPNPFHQFGAEGNSLIRIATRVICHQPRKGFCLNCHHLNEGIKESPAELMRPTGSSARDRLCSLMRRLANLQSIGLFCLSQDSDCRLVAISAVRIVSDCALPTSPSGPKAATWPWPDPTNLDPLTLRSEFSLV